MNNKATLPFFALILSTLMLSIGLLVSTAAQSATIPIDLNDFVPFDPADPVFISPDGQTAILSEDAALSTILLINDPGFGDPNVILPGDNVFLKFEYEFSEPATNIDEFGAFLFDADSGFTPEPASDFEFFTQATSSGTISFDLSSLTALTLGLQFQLSSLPGDTGLDSQVTISNVRLETIPLPPALFLFGSALIGLVGFRKKA
jgi:hypothetical protein